MCRKKTRSSKGKRDRDKESVPKDQVPQQQQQQAEADAAEEEKEAPPIVYVEAPIPKVNPWAKPPAPEPAAVPVKQKATEKGKCGLMYNGQNICRRRHVSSCLDMQVAKYIILYSSFRHLN